MRIAIWAILAYLIFLTYAVFAIQQGLWQAVEANFEYSNSPQPSGTIPCSSEINPDCEIYVK